MTAAADRKLLRLLAMRLAGACHSRRLYAPGSKAWENTVHALHGDVDAFFGASELEELTFALFEEGLAVAGLPILDPAPRVQRLMETLSRRDIEIVSVKRGCTASELETLLAFLTADAADVSGVRGNAWLRERGAERVEIKHLRITGGGGLQTFRDVYRMGRDVMAREFGRAAEHGHVDLGPIRELSSALLDLVFHSDTPIATLLALRERDDYNYVHSINVGMLVSCQAAAIGMPEDEVHEAAVAGLLHDIGKTVVPENILRSERPLTPSEIQILDTHTEEGARILYATQGAQRLAPLVAFEHHTRWDDPEASEPVVVTQLVALADCFDGIRTLRPFDDRESMRSALGYMLKLMRKRFNPYFLMRFATLCGLFLPGDHMLLSTGEVAEVIETHPEHALQPKVEIVDTREGSASVGTFLDLSRHARGPSSIRAVVPISSRFADIDPAEVDRLG